MRRKSWTLLVMAGVVLSFLSGCNEQSVLSAINAEFDFDALNDVRYEILTDANNISHLEGHNIADGDYEITSSLLTINKNYLVTLAPGQYELTVYFLSSSEKISISVLDKNNAYRLINGGFETGDYFGWMSHTVFKGEKNLDAFANEAISVNGDIAATAEAYNGDGNYVYGIPEMSSKTVWEEKMGHLVSSSFILGGSGWLSFKLGGGKHASYAYVSIRKVSDNTEVARFANRWFNDTGHASVVFGSAIGNAEAFLFPYYFNLSTVASLGTELYIVLSDTSAKEWSILSADSFVTYYPTAPTLPAVDTAKYLADNILPSVTGIDTASNSIPNGNPISSDSGWTFVGTGWGRDGDSMKSNRLNGDSDVGILRSSAFDVSTNKYARFDWAGGLAFDKRIFLSVKEVGSNI